MQTIEEFRIGEVILKQGEQSKGFYVLEKGAVEVLKNDVMLNVLMYPGTIFGEIGEILNDARTCTIRARSQTQVTKYECPDLDSLVQQHPEIAVKIMQTLASRLERTTQKLADLSNMSAFWTDTTK
ncbi:Crp/Fnr family transcriptional regulator [Coraliomargarita sp. SDUM461004]|uniref:Crp/Fnr family transcriptional regulator n=1 Tax=Thalassobacterium sedimentorum TaxID=3041258 RepID=A0ABU1AHY5_9BACT|nr:Crp/Fnr family transcriptional regulator [Coraliomargarita sp. SDUM461004]MDQ8194424.1 Crp/Fnr family transcriptional regulator [Coraliomargarita sp. SDUM461004]